jgi:quercetin dioxygenase-like cupin family protein
MGLLLTFLATGKETGGQFALLDTTVSEGHEPPPHTHSKEDETFYLLEGELILRVDEETLHAKKGDLVFLPRNVQHSWRAVIDTRLLVLITPAGLENAFMAGTAPAASLTLPPPQPMSEEISQEAVALANAYGVVYAFQSTVETTA